jgi:N-acetylmuramoyl-L-alanine amidase
VDLKLRSLSRVAGETVPPFEAKLEIGALVPDSAVVSAVCPSPNHGERRGCAGPDMILLHYTGMASSEEALRKLCDGGATSVPKVSAHYFVREDGGVVQCVSETRRAWHAGVSSWESSDDINSRSIGIEIANPGHDFGCPEFPQVQIAAVIALCGDILDRHCIRADRILAHSDVAPGRKRDPGEKFPWPLLFAHGVGLWVEPAPITAGPALGPGDRGTAVAGLQQTLARYGYGIAADGHFEGSTTEVITAFQRHFRPALIDGRADRSTCDTLRRLLALRDQIPGDHRSGIMVAQ